MRRTPPEKREAQGVQPLSLGDFANADPRDGQLAIATRRLERLTSDLEAVADWEADLASRLRCAHLRFEFCGLDPDEQEALAEEVAAFKRVCAGLAGEKPAA